MNLSDLKQGSESNPVRTMIFVDGQNLFFRARDAFGHTWPNYELNGLSQSICDRHGWTPTTVRFYTGVPDSQYDPIGSQIWARRKLAWKRRGIHFVTRPLRYTPVCDAAGAVTHYEPREKGIDVRIALDMVSTARSHQWDAIILFSQDNDLQEAVDETLSIFASQGRQFNGICAFPQLSSGYNRGISGLAWWRIQETDYNKHLDVTDYRG